MPDRTTCPVCGAELNAGSPRVLCPGCLLRAGLADDTRTHARNADPAAEAASGSVLALIAAAVGSVPRVLLRDSTPGEEPGPIVRPQTDGADGSIRYRIDGEIDRGGMGVILKGRDPDLGRDVALKVLREDHRENPDMVRRFVEEAQICGQLQHPGVVPIYEVGRFADRRPFFAMKLVKGRTLAQLLEAPLTARRRPAAVPLHLRGRLPDRRVRQSIFEAVCQTVAYAHARGVIHRDLKPSNVMVGSFGEVQVMDWGLAKVLPRGGERDDRAGEPARQQTVIATARSHSGEPGLSHPGGAMGTPSYMAPEQARGEIDIIDERADVFALGSILCELLTGEPAFTGRGSPEITRKASRGETAEALSRLDSCGADAELVSLARDCLEIDPEDRPRHAGAVAERVTAHLAGVQERVRAAERERAVAEARAIEERKRLRWQFVAAVCLFALNMCIAWFNWQMTERNRSKNAENAERNTEHYRTEARVYHELALKDPENAAYWDGESSALGLAWPSAKTLDDASRLEALSREARERATAARRDKALLDAVAKVRSGRRALGVAGTDDAYTRAFRDAGLDLEVLSPAEFGSRLKARPESVAVKAAAALDDWALVRRGDSPRDARWRSPLEAARIADPDMFRNRVREAILEEDPERREAALRSAAADGMAVDLQPASSVLLGSALKDTSIALALLRAAANRHPEEVWVNYTLAERLGELRPAPREQQVRYFSAARAVRPDTGLKLALLLLSMGRTDDALAVFADLIDRRPGDKTDLRLSAVCAAVAAAGAGKDAPIDDAARAKLRAEALAWLKAERDAWSKLLETGPPQSRANVAKTLQHWKVDSDLAGVRDAADLAKLPEAERKEWQALWADVEGLLDRAQKQSDGPK
jgi:serine/threonine-protein kinase